MITATRGRVPDGQLRAVYRCHPCDQLRDFGGADAGCGRVRHVVRRRDKSRPTIAVTRAEEARMERGTRACPLVSSASRWRPVHAIPLYGVSKERADRDGARTGICFRAEQPLLFAGKRDELDVGMEFKAEFPNSMGDGEQRDSARTIVVATGCLKHCRVTRRAQRRIQRIHSRAMNQMTHESHSDQRSRRATPSLPCRRIYCTQDRQR